MSFINQGQRSVIKSLQVIEVNCVADNAGHSVTITSVNTAKAVLVQTGSYNNTTPATTALSSARITSATNIQLVATGATNTDHIYQELSVVEYF